QETLRREAFGEEDDVLHLLRRAAQGLGGLPEAVDYPGLAPGAYRADALRDLVHVGVLLEGHQPAVVATEGEDAYLVVWPQGLDSADGSGLGDVGLDHTAGTVHELALFGAVAGPHGFAGVDEKHLGDLDLPLDVERFAVDRAQGLQRRVEGAAEAVGGGAADRHQCASEGPDVTVARGEVGLAEITGPDVDEDHGLVGGELIDATQLTDVDHRHLDAGRFEHPGEHRAIPGLALDHEDAGRPGHLDRARGRVVGGHGVPGHPHAGLQLLQAGLSGDDLEVEAVRARLQIHLTGLDRPALAAELHHSRAGDRRHDLDRRREGLALVDTGGDVDAGDGRIG